MALPSLLRGGGSARPGWGKLKFEKSRYRMQKVIDNYNTCNNIYSHKETLND
jgi:hypothetical protein